MVGLCFWIDDKDTILAASKKSSNQFPITGTALGISFGIKGQQCFGVAQPVANLGLDITKCLNLPLVPPDTQSGIDQGLIEPFQLRGIGTGIADKDIIRLFHDPLARALCNRYTEVAENYGSSKP